MWPFGSRPKKANPEVLAAIVSERPVLEALPEEPKEIGDWTKKVVASSKAPPFPLPLKNTLQGALDQISSKMRGVTLLPIEEESLRKLNEVAARDVLDKIYPRLDLEVLRWRKMQAGNKVPVFGIFNPFERNNKFHMKTYSSLAPHIEIAGWSKPQFSEYYEDMRNNEAYEAEFAGFVPVEIRTQMEALKNYYDLLDIFIVAECDWKVRITPPDPLVMVCYKGKATDAWLVASFDTTPIENVAKSEFSWRK